MRFLLLSAILAAACSAGFASRIICYYDNNSKYGSKFKVEDIDPTLCTHIVYTFWGLDGNSAIVSLDSWNDLGDEWNEGGLKKFLRLKNKNPSVKLLLGVGGHNQGPVGFMTMVRDTKRRETFRASTLKFLKDFKFDGIEIMWFYNGGWGGTEADKEGFSLLVSEMKPVYEKSGYVLGIATSPLPEVIQTSYNLRTLSKFVDYINVLSYDYNGAWSPMTAHGAPIDCVGKLCLKSTFVDYVHNYEVNPEKLNIGVVTYGRSFTLKKSGSSDYKQEHKGAGKIEPLPYRTFCVQYRSGIWIKMLDKEAEAPYAVDGKDQWVGYEDADYLKEKIQFAKSYHLGGVSIWPIDGDDFRNDCGSGKYTLLRAINEEMKK